MLELGITTKMYIDYKNSHGVKRLFSTYRYHTFKIRLLHSSRIFKTVGTISSSKQKTFFK